MTRSARLRRRAAILLIALSPAACTVIGSERVEGWPALQIVEHRVPHHEMRDRCSRYVGFGSAPQACAEFDFDTARCDIWYSADFPPQPFIVEHEREHCQGYEHAGEHHMRAGLQAYLAQKRKAGTAN